MKLLNRRHALQAALAGAGTIAGARFAALAQSQKLRIGVILPLTGVQAAFAADSKLGGDIAAERINKAGGVLGRQIELVYRDDKINPNEAISAARELAADGVKLIIGGYNTGTTTSITAIARDLDIVFMSCGAASDALTHELYTRNYFRSNNNSYGRQRAQAKLAAENYPQATNWSAILFDNEYSHAAFNAFKDGLHEYYPAIAGKDPVINEPIYGKPGSGDFKNQIAQLAVAGAHGLFNATAGADAITFFSQAKAFGLSNSLKVIMDHGSDTIIAKAMKKGLPPNFWTASAWAFSSYQNTPIGRHLYEEYRARTGDAYPSGYLAVVNVCLDSFAFAVKQAGGTATDGVIKALEGTLIPTAKGDVMFRAADHQSLGDVDVVEMNPMDNADGWGITRTISIKGSDVMEPATPGQKLVYKFS